MELSIVKIVPEVLVKALCNTLIHSLWQGLLLAAIAGLIMTFTRKKSASQRYNLLIAALFLFACATTYTFINQLSKANIPQQHGSTITHIGAVVNTPVITIPDQVASTTTFSSTLLGYFNQHAYTIVLIWLLIVCARSIQLITGLHSLFHLKRKNLFQVDQYWIDRVNVLSEKLGIRQMVYIAESGLAKVPMVIGHLKPMILIPVGLLTALPPAEIEAILVHELAHIHRRDYLVNLLQSFMEIIFFFNPAVLWISSLIRAERENCCDDIAVQQTSSKVNYIRALVSCQEYVFAAPSYAMAIKGSKGDLLGRVKRMATNSNQSLNLMERSVLAICLLTAGLLTAAFSNADKIDKLVKSTTQIITKANNTATQSLPRTWKQGRLRIYNPREVDENTTIKVVNDDKSTTHVMKENGILYQINLKSDRINSMQINGKTISAGRMATYRSIIAKLLKRDLTESEETQELAMAKDAQVAEDKLGYATQQLNTSLEQLNASREKLNAAHNKALADSARQAGHQMLIKAAPNINAPVVPQVAEVAVSPSPITPIPPMPPTTSTYQPKGYKGYEKSYTPQKEESQRDQLTAELIKEGLIPKKEDLVSFKLSNKEFILNGKKQPDEIFQKVRSKYVKVASYGDWSWLFNYDVTDKGKKVTTETRTTSETSKQ